MRLLVAHVVVALHLSLLAVNGGLGSISPGPEIGPESGEPKLVPLESSCSPEKDCENGIRISPFMTEIFEK